MEGIGAAVDGYREFMTRCRADAFPSESGRASSASSMNEGGDSASSALHAPLARGFSVSARRVDDMFGV
jgi:hypothetical protein